MSEPIMNQARLLAVAAEDLYKQLGAAQWDTAQRSSRTCLSLASQLHARVTAMVEAWAEMNRRDTEN